MSALAGNPDRVLRRLEWTAIRRLDGLLQGDYRTLFRGMGLDLADLREYQFQDDVRYIDWNVTARMQTPYVREYYEDRDVTAWFLLDVSPSMDFGSGNVKKQAMLIGFVAVLARLLTRQGNHVGAMLYGGTLDTVIPAGKSRRHVLHIVNSLMNRPSMAGSAPTDLEQFLRAAMQIIRRRSLVFVVSDFISAPGWPRPLAHLAQRHELLSVRVVDPLERSLPDLGLMVMQDAETGEQLLVDTHDRGFRRRFERAAARREAQLRASFEQAGVDTLELGTEDELVSALLRFADMRKLRSRLTAGGTLPDHLRDRS